MSEITPELNLQTAELDDDTADYLTIALRESLQTLDGAFNATTGHTHNGAHQGGALEYQDVEIENSLTVHGTLLVEDTSHLQGALMVDDLATLESLDVLTTSRLRGAVTMDGAASIAGNASIAGSVLLMGSAQLNSDLRVGGRLIRGGYDPGAGWANCFGGPLICDSRLYQRGNGSWFCYDSGDFTFSVEATATTLVQRDGSGQIKASRIQMAAAAEALTPRPTHVLGQNGDGWMRWWPASAIGPPVNVLSMSGTLANATVPGNPGGSVVPAATAASNTLGGTGSGTQTLTLNRTGEYVLYARARSSSQVFTDNVTWQVDILVNGVAQGSVGATAPNNGYNSSGTSRTHAWYRALLNAGTTIQFRLSQSANSGYALAAVEGAFDIVFIPTQDNPGFTS